MKSQTENSKRMKKIRLGTRMQTVEQKKEGDARCECTINEDRNIEENPV